MKKRFDELTSSFGPSQVILDINNWGDEHVERVLKDYGRFVEQFELYYETLVQACHAMNYVEKKNWPKYRSVQFFLIVHNLKSLYSAFDRFKRGFYEDSMILLRPAYEGFIKSIYITCHPDEPYAVVTGRKFNLTQFINYDLGLRWNEYKLFSAQSHANQFSVLQEAWKIEKNGQKEAITLRLSFNQKMLEANINDMAFIVLVFLKTVFELFITPTNQEFAQEELNKIKELILLREEDFLLHPKDYWPQVIRDERMIFTMLKRVESEKADWKTIWRDVVSGSAGERS